KTDDSRDVLARCRVIAHVVRRHPVFIAPNVTQQHQHEPGEIENEFFNRNRSAHGRYFPTESGRFVWENEESVAKQKVEEETERRRVIRRRLQNDGMKYCPQRERGRNDKRGRDSKNYKERCSILHVPKPNQDRFGF